MKIHYYFTIINSRVTRNYATEIPVDCLRFARDAGPQSIFSLTAVFIIPIEDAAAIQNQPSPPIIFIYAS